MSMGQRDDWAIPEKTQEVARAAFPKGNVYLTMRDELGVFYQDSEFAQLFGRRGPRGIAPGMLALVSVMQYAENLSDRQAADAVRGRIDWKYALGLELSDPGFDASVLSEFRQRLVAGGQEMQLLEDMLQVFQQRGWLRERGQQRTDSTHMLAKIRALNRLEMVGETLRSGLNQVAREAPEWLDRWMPAEWKERYGTRFQQYRLPAKGPERDALGERIGADGMQLLEAIFSEAAPGGLRELQAVQILRQVWIQQYWVDEGRVRWRAAQDLPPVQQRICSPYDDQARFAVKRSQEWTGFKTHLTETCEEDLPRLITDVQTTVASVQDVCLTAVIHQTLEERGLLPGQHVVDAGYVDARLIVQAKIRYGIDLVGPPRSDVSWQARDPDAFALHDFQIDWDQQQVICPQGHPSSSWMLHHGDQEKERIYVAFRASDCKPCPVRAHCTRAAQGARHLTFQPQPYQQALHTARQRQSTEAYRQTYARRAGVEGTISQSVRRTDARQARYGGLALSHLQNVLSVAAVNLTRAVAWLQEVPVASTRSSVFADFAEARAA